MLRKIISGGQTGADFAGLLAGKTLKLETGGYAPKGWKTEKGVHPELANYGLIQAANGNYKTRTELNACISDGTVIFGNAKSAGSKQTIFFAKKYDKPYLVMNGMFEKDYKEFLEWVKVNTIEVLNVAGNRESGNPGIERRVYSFLTVSLGEQ